MCIRDRTWLSRQELTVIRPLIYVTEDKIRSYAQTEALPVIPSCCPANGKTKRQDMKEMVAPLTEVAPHVRQRAIRALQGLSGNPWQISRTQKEEA